MPRLAADAGVPRLRAAAPRVYDDDDEGVYRYEGAVAAVAAGAAGVEEAAAEAAARRCALTEAAVAGTADCVAGVVAADRGGGG